MEQQSEAQESSSTANLDLSEEGSFLSPEESSSLLSSLESLDRRVLSETRESIANEDDGLFLSPDDIEEEGMPGEAGVEMPSAIPRGQGQGDKSATREDTPQSDLLSKIAAELRSIKTEIGTLKVNYDSMIEKASSIADTEASGDSPRGESPRTEVAPPPPAGFLLPEETLADLKKLLAYLDRLLESLPEDKIDGFARSEYFELYRKIFEFFDLV